MEYSPERSGAEDSDLDGDGDGDGDADADGSPNLEEPISGGTASEPPLDCSGSFGEWEPLFEDPGWISQALTPSPDGLEFFYARFALDTALDNSGTRLPTVRTRATIESDFGEPTVLWNLTSACENARSGTELAGLDLSFDGRRLYLACSTFNFAADSTGPLLMFERAAAGASFELPPTVVGEVGVSLGLSRDELHAFGTSLDPSTRVVVSYHRSSLVEPFGPAQIVPGGVALSNPEPSPDALSLWGAMTVQDGVASQLGVARYNDETGAFDQPTRVGPAPPEGSSDISPALSGDCRAMYIVRYTSSALHSQVMRARR